MRWPFHFDHDQTWRTGPERGRNLCLKYAHWSCWGACSLSGRIRGAAQAPARIRRRRGRHPLSRRCTGTATVRHDPDSISLFGDFGARPPQQGRNLPVQRPAQGRLSADPQHNAEGRSISSQQLSSLLWPDKPDKVEELRGVTINHLHTQDIGRDGRHRADPYGAVSNWCKTNRSTAITRCCELTSSGRSRRQPRRADRILGGANS